MKDFDETLRGIVAGLNELGDHAPTQCASRLGRAATHLDHLLVEALFNPRAAAKNALDTTRTATKAVGGIALIGASVGIGLLRCEKPSPDTSPTDTPK